MPHTKPAYLKTVWRVDNKYSGACTKCDREFSNKTAMRMHIRSKHPDGVDEKNRDVAICGICKKILQHGRRCQNC